MGPGRRRRKKRKKKFKRGLTGLTKSEVAKIITIKPILKNIKKNIINWLFFLLSQLLSSCTINQFKYFCKYTNNHPIGTKNDFLYLTYLSLLK
uniref:DUF7086 domain-containing protein n=1 Tax=Cajanus cajan TaxID=3821 RepID=A0A151U7A6_CAJCA|nr:hypothetical protein KK1_007882 [Cajanus cajan]